MRRAWVEVGFGFEMWVAGEFGIREWQRSKDGVDSILTLRELNL